MADVDAAVQAAKETTVFLAYFEDLSDYRQRGKIAYRLDKVLLPMLAASLAEAEAVADMARFGQAKLGLAVSGLRQRRAFARSVGRHSGQVLARRHFSAASRHGP